MEEATNNPIQFEKLISKESVCCLSGCQSAYQHYLAVFKLHVDQAEEIQRLRDERDQLLFNEGHKLELMRQHISLLEEEYCSKEALVLDTLQGKPGTKPLDLRKGMPRACKGCVHYKAALENLHATNANALPAAQERAQKMQHIVESAEKRAKAVIKISTHLQTLLARDKDPFWRDLDMERLTSEVLSLQREREAQEKEGLLLKEELGKVKAQLDKMNVQNSDLRADLNDACRALSAARAKGKADEEQRARQKRKAEAQEEWSAKKKRKAETAVLNEALRAKLGSVFQIKKWETGKVEEERTLFDAFWHSMPTLEEKEHWLGMIYAATHSGKMLTPQERRLLKEGKQVCRTSFTTCLREMGGITRKRGNQNPFINVEIKGGEK